MNALMYGLGRAVNCLIAALGVIVGVVMLLILVGLVVAAYQAVFC